jgi:short-subunit dehydrogenase
MALVTGASSGIGAEFARQIAEDGYDLTLVARRTERLEALAVELRAKYGVSAEAVAADLTRDEDVARVGRLLAESAHLALLVNNAGFGTKGFFFETDPGPQDDMHRLHVLAAERLMRAALPGMMARRRGGIVNVSSVAGFFQSPSNISYCATKAWMSSFTEGLHMELKMLGSPVVVQALCPGYTWSEFHDAMGADRGEVPKNWWMPAEFVVRESLRGLKEGKLFVIPGWRYKLLVRLMKLVPRQIFAWGAARQRKPRRV